MIDSARAFWTAAAPPSRYDDPVISGARGLFYCGLLCAVAALLVAAFYACAPFSSTEVAIDGGAVDASDGGAVSDSDAAGVDAANLDADSGCSNTGVVVNGPCRAAECKGDTTQCCVGSTVACSNLGDACPGLSLQCLTAADCCAEGGDACPVRCCLTGVTLDEQQCPIQIKLQGGARAQCDLSGTAACVAVACEGACPEGLRCVHAVVASTTGAPTVDVGLGLCIP
jgi:hypothetical protein